MVKDNRKQNRKEKTMQKDANTILLFTEHRAAIDYLSDEDAGKLIKALFAYVDEGKFQWADDVSLHGNPYPDRPKPRSVQGKMREEPLKLDETKGHAG